MGSSHAKVMPPAAPQPDPFDWGTPPEGPSHDELEKTEELVLQTWASCKAKPVDAKFIRSDDDEKSRRESLKWRKRTSFIELDCGEDSFFVANTYRAIGVADGVGGWRDEGFDPALFPNELMRNAKLYAETHRKDRDPESIMKNAYEKTVHDRNIEAGSSTFLCATLVDSPTDNKTFLDVANLGDGSCIVIRHHDVIQRAHEKIHSVNAPMQLSILPDAYKGRAYSDAVEDSVRESFEVRQGDVVVIGSDGLFDNRFVSQIAAEAGWIGDTPLSPFDGVPLIGNILKVLTGPRQNLEFRDPYRIVQRLVQDAYKTSLDTKADTPWADSLRYLGVEHAEGGKVDDITVLVSRVTTRSQLMETTMW